MLDEPTASVESDLADRLLRDLLERSPRGVVPTDAGRQLLFPALAVAAYLHGRHLSARRDPLLQAVAALPAAGYTAVELWAGVDALLMLGIAVTLPWLAGRFRRQQADLVTAAAERVTHLERERQFVADRARLLAGCSPGTRLAWRLVGRRRYRAAVVTNSQRSAASSSRCADRRFASSSESTVNSAATGPNTSSASRAISAVRPESRVGS